jgi:hypothetical protein
MLGGFVGANRGLGRGNRTSAVWRPELNSQTAGRAQPNLKVKVVRAFKALK